MHQLLLWHEPALPWLIVFACAFICQVVFLLAFPLSIARSRKSADGSFAGPVSVIICAKNEERNLMDHVPLIMEQDYPEFELIIVNDSSWDDTEAILKALKVEFPAIRIVHLDEEKQNMSGKKFALTLGIKAAKNDIILLTDADCKPASPSWIRYMVAPMANSKTEIVLGFSPYKLEGGWLNHIIRFDTWFNALQYLGFARAGIPYMGVGRNLCYRRNLFFQNGGFKSHYHIASGDDDLFINEVANRFNTATVFVAEAQTISEPKRSLRDFFLQKKRHFTTAPFYKTNHKMMLGLWPLSYTAMLAAAVVVLVMQAMILPVAGALFVRYLLVIAIFRPAAIKMGQPIHLAWLAPLLEMQTVTLNALIFFTNLIQKPKKWN